MAALKKLKIGFMAGFMDGFSEIGIDLFRRYQKELDRMGERMGFETVHYPKVMLTLKDAKEIREDLDAKEVDFLLLFHPSYIIGDNVFEVMKTRARVGLWAIEEPRDEGPMPLASFVNLCQNASIARHNFKGRAKKTKWFFGPVEGPLFKPRFEITVRALLAEKNLRGARVAQIGKLADGHINHYNDVRDIYEHLGVDVTRDFEVEDIVALGEKVAGPEVARELADLRSKTSSARIGESKVESSVRMYLAIKKICEDQGYSAVAFSCWPKLMPQKGMSGCLVNALLNNAGIPAGCEGDVLSTVSMLALRYFSLGKSVVVMDLPKFDVSDDSLMLWHCGTCPFDMADSKGVRLDRHYFAEYSKQEILMDCGPITDAKFRPSDITVFRFTGEAESFYYFTGKTFDGGKKTFDGSRGWVKDLELFGEPVKVLDLVNTMLVRGLPHHYPMVMENVGPAVEEFAWWTGLKKVKKAEYRDCLYVED
jgi:L-fucose isomerase-like protein